MATITNAREQPSQAIKICVAGATGQMGGRVVRAILGRDDMVLVGATGRRHAGARISDVLPDCDANVIVSRSASEAFGKQCDVLVDYSTVECARLNVLEAIHRGIHSVVGTTGFEEKDFVEIGRAAAKNGVGVLIAANLSLTLALLQKCALLATRYCSACEAIDYAGPETLKLPLGTTAEVVRRLAASKGRPSAQDQDVADILLDDRPKGDAIPVHSVRLPGCFSSLEIIFGSEDQQLSIRHTCLNAKPWVDGTLFAVRQIIGRSGLVRGLDGLLD